MIFDNLYADKKAVPMIVVLPNGRAAKDVTAREPIPKQSPAFAAFEKDLLTDLISLVEKAYSVKADREARALVGLSMGGGQALNFGLIHLRTHSNSANLQRSHRQALANGCRLRAPVRNIACSDRHRP